MPEPILHLMAGKIASGKSTLAKSLASDCSAILLSEDHWLSQLYPDQVESVLDYVRLSRLLEFPTVSTTSNWMMRPVGPPTTALEAFAD